jgi:hypothetical protein
MISIQFFKIKFGSNKIHKLAFHVWMTFFHCVLVLIATNGLECEKYVIIMNFIYWIFYNQNKFYHFFKKAMTLNWNALKRVCQFKQRDFHKNIVNLIHET